MRYPMQGGLSGRLGPYQRSNASIIKAADREACPRLFDFVFRCGAAGYWLPCMSAPNEPGDGPFFAFFLAWRRGFDLAARFGG